jgi:hypothetical protein
VWGVCGGKVCGSVSVSVFHCLWLMEENSCSLEKEKKRKEKREKKQPQN